MSVIFGESAAYWSYDAFHQFRVKLAKEINIPLNLMDGYTEGKGIKWDTFRDPIKPFLMCDDIDGSFTPGQCKDIAVRLLQLTSFWSDADEDKHKAFSLAMVMKGHAQFNLPLRF